MTPDLSLPRLTEFARYAQIMGWEALSRSRGCLDPARDRDDAAQEILVAAWQALEADPDQPPAWLNRTARQAGWHFVNRDRVTGRPPRPRGGRKSAGVPDRILCVPLEYGEHVASDGDHAPHVVDQVAVETALKELRPEDRIHVHMRFWDGASADEIAAALGVKRHNVHDAWRTRIAPRLRVLLDDAA